MDGNDHHEAFKKILATRDPEENNLKNATVTRRGNIWVFPKIGVPQNGWFIMENTIKMDDLGVALFLETSTFLYFQTEFSRSNLIAFPARITLKMIDPQDE